MDARVYTKILKGIGSSSPAYTCPYCGMINYSPVGAFFCSGCEAFVPSPKEIGQEKIRRAQEIRDFVKGNSFGEAEKAYESIEEYTTNPYFPYSEALVCILESNYEAGKIDYMLKGFMEDNVTHRNNSLASFSKAKLLFAKAIFTARKNISGGENTAEYLHAMFMSYIKSGDLKAAHATLEKVEKLGDALVSEYENMVLKSNLGDYEGMAKHAEKLLSKDMFAVNAAYYLAYSLFKTKKLKEALILLESFPDSTENEAVKALIKEIKRCLEV
ncbi:MAG: tetratricopeptide repeat protein [Candidatus Micrarchaeia archaeon]